MSTFIRLSCFVPKSILSFERSTRQATPASFDPDDFTRAMTSFVESPVVITSSTTKTVSSFSSWKPLLKIIFPSTLSVKRLFALSARATSWETRMPPMAGAITASIFVVLN